MTLICPECGEKEDFEKVITGTSAYSERCQIDSEGVEIDYTDYETNDSWRDEEQSPPYCRKCEATIKNIDGKQNYIHFVCTHTDSNGNWSKTELPINEELKTEMEAEDMATQIVGVKE